MEALLSSTLSSIASPILDDPIWECFSNDNTKLPTLLCKDPEKALSLADAELRVFPFKDVKDCWRRLYTDASIVKACYIIREHGQGETKTREVGDGEELTEMKEHKQWKENTKCIIDPQAPWLSSVIHILDKALIMTGAPQREILIESLMSTLQEATGCPSIFRPPWELLSHTPSKRRRVYAPLFSPDAVPAPPLAYAVPRISALSLEDFVQHIHAVRTPIVITGAVDHWPAFSSRPWSSRKYWFHRTFGGRRLVPVEVGRSYTDEGWGQRIISFSDFVNNYLWASDEKVEAKGREASTAPAQSRQGQTGYMAQHNLLAQIPSLKKDICIPDYCYTDPPGPEPGTPVYEKKLREQFANRASTLSTISQRLHDGGIGQPPFIRRDPIKSFNLDDGGDENDQESSEAEPIINTWIGPAWTISPLHHDPYHNILVQVVGAKYVRLYSPHTPTSRIYPRGMEIVDPSLHNSSPPNDGSSPVVADSFVEQVETTSTLDKDTKAILNHKHDQRPQPRQIDMSNTSQVDIAAIELSPAESETWETLWPGFSDAEYVETVLSEGECLYIPVGWWHYVRALKGGISVSFWWG